MNKLFAFFLIFFPTPALSDSDASTVAAGPKSYSIIDKYWPSPPDVFICSDLKISRSRIHAAVNYWEKLGYTFGNIEYNYNGLGCHGRPYYGSITITIPDQNFDLSKLAINKSTFNPNTKEMHYSVIQIPEFNVSKERVLEHEIGHALGWEHSYRRYYIMNENWKLGGHDSTGLSHRRYLELVNKLREKAPGR